MAFWYLFPADPVVLQLPPEDKLSRTKSDSNPGIAFQGTACIFYPHVVKLLRDGSEREEGVKEFLSVTILPLKKAIPQAAFGKESTTITGLIIT